MIADVTLVDPAASATRPRMHVVVLNGRIADVLDPPNRSFPAGARIVDGRGKYLIPGLWDMHWHAFSEQTMRRSFLPLAIAQGATSVRDMAADCLADCGSYPDIFAIKKWRDQIAIGSQVGPRMVLASPLVDGPHPAHAGSVAVGSAEQARRAVAMLHQRGAEFIKVYSYLPRDAYFAIAEETKRLGIGFAGHTPDAITLREAANAGQRSNEHLTNVLLECSHDEDRVRQELLALAEVETEGQDLAWNQYERKARRLFAELELRVVGELHRAGVPLLAGTDVGVEYIYPGFSLHDELEWLVEAGLAPAEALATATSNPARFLGRTGSLGQIERGQEADLVLLDRIPLTRIRNSRGIAGVLARGRWF